MEKNDTKTSAEIIERLAAQQIKDIKVEVYDRSKDRSKKHYVPLPTGVELKEVVQLDAKVPQNNKTFIDADSFERYVKAFANPKESRLFGFLGTTTLVGVIDYEEVNNTPRLAVDGEKSHIANLKITKTEDLKAWESINDKPLEQAVFVEFLLERAACVINPDSARMLEIATTLQMKSDVTFSSQERTTDGGFNLVYREDIAANAGANGKVKVPDTLNLKFVAFEGGTPMELRARIYYKLYSGKVVFRVKILRLRETILETFRATCDKAAKKLGLDVHYCE